MKVNPIFDFYYLHFLLWEEKEKGRRRCQLERITSDDEVDYVLAHTQHQHQREIESKNLFSSFWVFFFHLIEENDELIIHQWPPTEEKEKKFRWTCRHNFFFGWGGDFFWFRVKRWTTDTHWQLTASFFFCRKSFLFFWVVVRVVHQELPFNQRNGPAGSIYWGRWLFFCFWGILLYIIEELLSSSSAIDLLFCLTHTHTP